MSATLTIKRIIIKLIPDLAWDLYRKYKYELSERDQLNIPSEAKATFTEIYDKNFWNSPESFSGTGSDDIQTRAISSRLPALWKKYKVTPLLDVPCGDFHWMRNVDLSGIQYTGGDIVESLIKRNNVNYAKSNISFEVIDLIQGPLPKVDMIFCRDCLVHFSYEHIAKAIENLKKSGATYFLTTSFVNRKLNFDIKTGHWRPINLRIAPFNFPQPLEVISEECTEGNGKSYDKSLLLFRVSDFDKVQTPFK